MSEAHLGVWQPCGMNDLSSLCAWVVDAHAAGDPYEIAPALSGLYRHLMELGWVAPSRASLLLDLQDEVVALELHRLLAPQRDGE